MERKIADERGFALVVALIVALVMISIGAGLMVGARGGIHVGTSEVSQAIAFEAAEAGLEEARERVRKAVYDDYMSIPARDIFDVTFDPSDVYDDVLNAAAGGNGLPNPNSVANFDGRTPWVPTTAVSSGGRFRVYLNNDRRSSEAGGPTSVTDTNNRLLLTSIGTGTGGVGFVGLQAEVGIAADGFPGLPGRIVMPGPTVVFDAGSSNAHLVNGHDPRANDCYAAIAVSTNAATAVVAGSLQHSNTLSTCNPADPTGPSFNGGNAVGNFVSNPGGGSDNPYDPSANSPVFPAGAVDLMRVDYLEQFVATLREKADFTSRGPGFTLGTTRDPKIVVMDGDFTMSEDGAGILVVRGQLTINGNRSYDGLILVIGEGVMEISGGGNLDSQGATLIANTQQPWVGDPAYVGVPTYLVNGGGTSNQVFDQTLAGAGITRSLAPLDRSFYRTVN